MYSPQSTAFSRLDSQQTPGSYFSIGLQLDHPDSIPAGQPDLDITITDDSSTFPATQVQNSVVHEQAGPLPNTPSFQEQAGPLCSFIALQEQAGPPPNSTPFKEQAGPPSPLPDTAPADSLLFATLPWPRVTGSGFAVSSAFPAPHPPLPDISCQIFEGAVPSRNVVNRKRDRDSMALSVKGAITENKAKDQKKISSASASAAAAEGEPDEMAGEDDGASDSGSSRR